MELKSSAFANNTQIPAKYTGDGLNISPPLNWAGAPHNAITFVLICDDPDAHGDPWVHWLVWNIPGDYNKLDEGLNSISVLPNGMVQGINDFKTLGYSGPCPPAGTHRYFFTLYALDREINISAYSSKEAIIVAMDGFILEKAELIGLYSRKK